MSDDLLIQDILKGMVHQFEACEAYRLRAIQAEHEAKILKEALVLAEGRISLLLKSYPEESATCDHPTATQYVLSRVRNALEGVDIDR